MIRKVQGRYFFLLETMRKAGMSRNHYSDTEIKRVSLRIKSARVLSGMNQEDFARTFEIPHVSLKTWESGKSLPRQTGITKFLSALSSSGVYIDEEWLLCGRGSGPTYVKNRESVTGIDERRGNVLIDAFRNEQTAQGLSPITVQVVDDEMFPLYRRGDIIGGVFLSYDEAKAFYESRNEKGLVFLMRVDDEQFAPRQVFFSDDGSLHFGSLKNPNLIRSQIQLLAKIIWHYFAASDT